MNESIGTVLLVEDNEDDAALTMRAFTRHKLANPVDVVSDGAAALDFLFSRGTFAFRSGKPLPYLIVLDLKLPKMNGLEVLRAIRQNVETKLIPVLILSSSKLEQDIKAAYMLGANSYLVKAINFDEFVENVRILGLYWLSLNQQPPSLNTEVI